MDEAISRETLIEKVVATFRSRFDKVPSHTITSPGRLNVIGEHVDYQGGIVLPASIERWICGAFQKNDSGTVRVYDLKYDDSGEIDPNASLSPEKGSWLNYPKGVFAQFQKRGVTIPGFDLCMYSNIPTGGGLSSSAALEALFASIVETLNDAPMDPMEKALLCQKAEHEYAGVPCGIMDQAAVIMGESQQLLKLDCRDLSIQHVPFKSESIGLMIIDSGVHHELADGAYKKRRDACELASKELGVETLRDASVDEVKAFAFSSDEIRNRALHVVSEIERTKRLIAAMEAGDFDLAGKLIQQSHHSLQYLFEVSCVELDFITSLCNAQPGVYGSRMMGGGFGGSAIVMLEKEVASEVASLVEISYFRHFGLQASAFLTSPAQGVLVESLS